MTTTDTGRTWGSPEAAEVWRQGAARRAQTLAAATEQMLDAAGLAPGMRVLDVAAGTGDQSVLAAQRIGASGSLLATDISASMLDVAAQAARDAGLSNVETHVADASALDLPPDTFDAGICRFGLMFVPDLDQALVRIHRALKPGARFAALVWSTREANPYIGLQIDLVNEMGRMPSPPPTIVRTVALSAPGTLDQAFERAGFREVSVSAVGTPRVFASLDEAVTAMHNSSPAQGELRRAMSDAESAHYSAELAQRLEAFVQPDGTCVLPGQALLGLGTK
jgi:ubiquinone/menaquinone biosynthesis C-methylase UbiE